MHFLGIVTFSAAMIPLRHEIAAAADTADRWQSVRRSLWQERRERIASDDSLRTVLQTNHDDVMRELGHIETLIVRHR